MQQFLIEAVILSELGGLAGILLGVAGGMWLGHAFTGLYDDYFGFPNLVYRTRMSTIAVGVPVSAAAALSGALWAVRGAVRMPPAEAMRPSSPARAISPMRDINDLSAPSGS